MMKIVLALASFGTAYGAGFTDGVDAYATAGYCYNTAGDTQTYLTGDAKTRPCSLDQAFCTFVEIAASGSYGWKDQSSTKDCTCSASSSTHGLQYNHDASGGDPTEEAALCHEIKFGSCYSMSTHVMTPVIGKTCPAGQTFIAHDHPTYGDGGADYTEVKIGFCYASDGKSPAGVTLANSGYCATEAAQCFSGTAATCSTGFTHADGGLKYISYTQAECAQDGICTVASKFSSVAGVSTEAACNTPNVWTAYPTGGVWQDEVVSTQSFKEPGDALNPDCTLADLTGDPADQTSASSSSSSSTSAPSAAPAATDTTNAPTAESGAVSTNAFTGLVVVTVALMAALWQA